MQTIRLTAAGLLILIALGACSNNAIGIFESIEIEREIEDDRDIANDINVGAIGRAANHYFIAAGALYYRDVTDPDYVNNDRAQWATATAPGTNYTTTSLVATDLNGTQTVLAVFSNRNGDDFKLVEYSPASPDTNGSTRLETGTDIGGEVIDELGEVFALDEDNDGVSEYVAVGAKISGETTYALFASSDGTTFTRIVGSEGSAFPYIDVVGTLADGTSGNIYLTLNQVFHDDDGIAGGNPVVELTGTGKDLAAIYTGALHDTDGSLIWLADNDGYLYSAGTGAPGTWTQSSQSAISTSNEDPVPFTDFASVLVGPLPREIMVGTNGYGYRMVGTAGSVTAGSVSVASPDEDGSNYQASDLAGTAVTVIFADDTWQEGYPIPTGDGNEYDSSNDGYLFFAGTANQGLWRALSYDGPVQWVRE